MWQVELRVSQNRLLLLFFNVTRKGCRKSVEGFQRGVPVLEIAWASFNEVHCRLCKCVGVVARWNFGSRFIHLCLTNKFCQYSHLIHNESS